MYSNSEIIEGLRINDPVLIKELYHLNFHLVRAWILKNSGTIEDVNDLFHDAFLIIIRKSRETNIYLTCDFSTYLVSICKHLWFQELRRRKKIKLSDLSEFNKLAETTMNSAENVRSDLFDKILDSLDERDRRLLALYNQKKTLKEIVRVLGFKNEQAVADKKKNCIKKLRKLLLNCEEYKELHFETSNSN